MPAFRMAAFSMFRRILQRCRPADNRRAHTYPERPRFRPFSGRSGPRLSHALHPTAMVPQRGRGKEHVFYGCGIILYRKAPVTIRAHPSCQHTNHRGRCLAKRRLDDPMQFSQQGRVIHRDQTGRLHIASGRRCEASLHDADQMLPWYRYAPVDAAVTPPRLNRFQRVRLLLLPLFPLLSGS